MSRPPTIPKPPIIPGTMPYPLVGRLDHRDGAAYAYPSSPLAAATPRSVSLKLPSHGRTSATSPVSP